MLAGVAAIVAVAASRGCSKEDREEAINRFSKAGKILNGEARPDDAEHEVPNIVAEQQRKERIRQNRTWTAENRALHPIEYCQAQLEELGKYAARLEASAHEINTKKSEVVRTKGDNEGQLKGLEKFLGEAKAAYRKCEAENSWPAQLGGFALSREKVREKIVEAARKIPALKARVGTQQNQLAGLGKKLEAVTREQKRTVALRERIETTISDLRLKKVIDGEKGIGDSLNAIDDAMGALGVDYGNPSLEDIMAPDGKSASDADFEKIMAQ